MKHIKIFRDLIAVALFMAIALSNTSCNFLDVVPDNVQKLEDVFNTREEAYNALAKVYNYLPADSRTHRSTWLMGDEYLHRLDYNNDNNLLSGVRIMRGMQSVTNPILGSWSGTGGGKKYYEAIRQCNIFLKYADGIKNMEEAERKEWKAQVTFLKAYYNFLLLQKYGPIIIYDEVVEPYATGENLFRTRSKVEDCFDYIIELIDKAIPDLKPMIESKTDYGMIDQITAASIKARILLFRASPFYNGNMEYFGDFIDPVDNKPYFSLTADKEKWKAVITATEEAIRLCVQNGKKLYRYEKTPYAFDRDFFVRNEARMQTLWDLRMIVSDPWNSELIWGMSNVDAFGNTDANQITSEIGGTANMRLPEDNMFAIGSDRNSPNWANQWLCASYDMAERYYTENGVPVDEDVTFPYSLRHELINTPDPSLSEEDSLAMIPWLGIMQPNVNTIRLYMNREMRFYANLAITGGYWRAHQFIIPVLMYENSFGGRFSSRPDDYFVTGIGIKKFVHPETGAGGWQRIIKFPYPIIRMADLYLMLAEACNEYEGPSQKVYDALNTVRRRAGIPDVEKVWADPQIVRNVDRHKDQRGLREIILRERSIEFSFEGSHFWDMLRHKRAPSEFSKSIQGWNANGTGASTFFVLEVKQPRKFSIRDCLWPIDLEELNTNRNLKQNPGW